MFATYVNLCKIKVLYVSGTTMNQNHQRDKGSHCLKILSMYATTLTFSTRKVAEVVTNLSLNRSLKLSIRFRKCIHLHDKLFVFESWLNSDAKFSHFVNMIIYFHVRHFLRASLIATSRYNDINLTVPHMSL